MGRRHCFPHERWGKWDSERVSNLPKVKLLENRGTSIQTQGCLTINLMVNGQVSYQMCFLSYLPWNMQDRTYKYLPTMQINRAAFNFLICNSQVIFSFFRKDHIGRKMSVSCVRQASYLLESRCDHSRWRYSKHVMGHIRKHMGITDHHMCSHQLTQHQWSTFRTQGISIQSPNSFSKC